MLFPSESRQHAASECLSSLMQAEAERDGDYLYHTESKCPSPLHSLKEEDSARLMPAYSLQELGHLTMGRGAVSSPLLHNTLSVMCGNYSQAPRKLLFYSVNAHGHDI